MVGTRQNVQSLSDDDKAVLRQMFEMNQHDTRARMYSILSEEIFQPEYGMDLAGDRERTQRQWMRLRALRVFDNVLVSRDVEKYDAILESVALLDHSMEVLLGVHYGLFGSTIARLGSSEQRDKWISKVEDCSMLGCFSLTELGHGSNVRGIETTATYDVATEEFVIHTPTDTAQKYWIGGAASTVHWTTAFAQLRIGEKDYGVHPFIVRLRDESGRCLPGVSIADCGHKLGLNGVDNGRIWFDNVRVPREMMLGGLSQVSADGTYSSHIADADQRFSAQLGALTGGRISISNNATNQAKIGLAIAIRYSQSRKAFGPPGGAEVPLMFYQSHQTRLMPYLATTCVYAFCANELKSMWYRSRTGLVPKAVHLWSSGFKSMMTSHMRDALQACREACGGQGYKSENRIGVIRADRDVALTFEGDNLVLLQQVAKAISGQFAAGLNRKLFKGDLEYLNKLNGKPTVGKTGLEFISREFTELVLMRRVRNILSALMSAIDDQRRRGVDEFNTWNNCQMLAISAARAHMDYVVWSVYESKLDEIDRVGPHSMIWQVLDLCSRVHIVSLLESASSFLMYECLSAEEALLAERAKVDLSRELSKHAVGLVEGFGIPDYMLAPIAFDWIAHNSLRRAKL